jgi:hypothetical protein
METAVIPFMFTNDEEKKHESILNEFLMVIGY